MNILIIEDNPIFQIKLCNIVHELGHKTQVIDGIDETKICFQTPEQFDLIISDIMLQDDSVFDINPWPNLPTIFITSFEDLNSMNSSLDIKNSLFLTKTFSDLTLKASILRLLQEQTISSNTNSITVFGKHKNPIHIPLDEILFITSEGNYSTIFTDNDKKYTTKRSAKLLITEQIALGVVRISRSTFVNRNKLTNVYINKCTVEVGRHLLVVSKKFKKNIYEFHNLN